MNLSILHRLVKHYEDLNDDCHLIYAKYSRLKRYLKRNSTDGYELDMNNREACSHLQQESSLKRRLDVNVTRACDDTILVTEANKLHPTDSEIETEANANAKDKDENVEKVEPRPRKESTPEPLKMDSKWTTPRLQSPMKETEEPTNAKPLPLPLPLLSKDTHEDAFKYVETIRKKSERDKMHGKSCPCCSSYYEAIKEDACVAAERENNDAGHANAISRHRFLHLPPSTPPGYWDVGFTPADS